MYPIFGPLARITTDPDGALAIGKYSSDFIHAEGGVYMIDWLVAVMSGLGAGLVFVALPTRFARSSKSLFSFSIAPTKSAIEIPLAFCYNTVTYFTLFLKGCNMLNKAGADWMVEAIAAYEQNKPSQSIAASLIYISETLELMRMLIDPETPENVEFPGGKEFPKS